MSRELIRLQVLPKLFGVNSWILQWIPYTKTHMTTSRPINVLLKFFKPCACFRGVQ